ncbi:MTH1187 family thiamine-binding protein [Thermophagus sp. OGC60D27]|uniref:MTH1187 family thiamine-binding protein n=1 Tax=Thermophagus sp. OGC60D27 TaxID=3458415 RepID=UPI0040384385
MSVLLNFAMFPTDKGASVSQYVSKVLEYVRDSGVAYRLDSMGTTIETETLEEALDVVNKAYLILEPVADRIYSTISIDARKGRSGRMDGKIQSIENKIGGVNQ